MQPVGDGGCSGAQEVISARPPGSVRALASERVAAPRSSAQASHRLVLDTSLLTCQQQSVCSDAFIALQALAGGPGMSPTYTCIHFGWTAAPSKVAVFSFPSPRKVEIQFPFASDANKSWCKIFIFQQLVLAPSCLPLIALLSSFPDRLL